MKNTMSMRSVIGLLSLIWLLQSCFPQEDPGPIQFDRKSYQALDFNRVEADGGLVLTLQQSPSFGITAEGDRRNLDDLQVLKLGTTLKLGFSSSRIRDHVTYVTVMMPEAVDIRMSGSCNVMASGFTSDMNVQLSGASIGQIETKSNNASLILSGASRLTLTGQASTLKIDLSGMSSLNAFGLPSDHVDIQTSGASEAKVWANQTLKAVATGSSLVFYRGNPSVSATATDGSDVRAY